MREITDTDRRHILDALGFEVMSLPYSGGLYYMRRLQPDRSWNPRDVEGRRYSINLDTGRWTCWGVGTWHNWEELPGAKSGADFDAPPAAAPPVEASRPAGEELHPFVERCRRVGFEIAPGGLSEFGNVLARFRGERFLITTTPPSIVDCRFDERRLEEFGAVPPDPAPPPAAAPTSPPKPRPTLASIVFEDRPVSTTGRNLQTSLFN